MKYLAILLIGIFTSCSSQKNVKKESLLYFGKTACLGKCPVYDVYVFSDGTVQYEGLQNVTKKGKHTYNLSSEELNKIKKELTIIEDVSSEKQLRDLPNTVIKYNGKGIKTQNKKQLEGLEKLLEKVIL